MEMEKLEPVYVEFMPSSLQEGKLYVSMLYGTCVHLCPCGCGEEVVTPLNSHGWILYFNGKVTLRPSIGNYDLPCKSHYFITDNRIEWLPTENRLDKGKKSKKRRKFMLKKSFPFFAFG